MKYKRLLSISVSIGTLLSVWAIIEKSTTSSQAANTDPPTPSPTSSPIPSPAVLKGKMHDVPITNFVKHNQGLMETQPSKIEARPLTGSKKQPSRNIMPWFFAQLVSEDGGITGYVRYLIIDSCGNFTEWHSKNTASTNESPTSTLFSTTFNYNKPLIVCYRDDGEVQIKGGDKPRYRPPSAA
jgi:hypothetical protein